MEHSLGPGWAGADISFDFRNLDRLGNETQVILRLHVALDEQAEARVTHAIETDYRRYLDTLSDHQSRELITHRLVFEVVGYGSRVS
jgi:hypothetical protein